MASTEDRSPESTNGSVNSDIAGSQQSSAADATAGYPRTCVRPDQRGDPRLTGTGRPSIFSAGEAFTFSSSASMF
ncbi:MAG: hypothetical protein CL403_07470 [Acidimicrobiaceae bacterium]|nr:hypothetical protein [Acidimicrobiaceae bacterium]